MLPLIIFDAVVNLYLTLLFVVPPRTLYSYKKHPNSGLRIVAIRSFVGSLATLTSSVVNLTVLVSLRGEAAWICLMCCNADILFSVLVLHWLTSIDNSGGSMAGTSPSGSSPHTLSLKKTLGRSTLCSASPYSVDGQSGNFGNPKGNGQVTTSISAGEEWKTNGELELQGRPKALKRKGEATDTKESVGRLHVYVAQVVEQEIAEPSSLGDEAEDITDLRKPASVGSTEDLVDK